MSDELQFKEIFCSQCSPSLRGEISSEPKNGATEPRRGFNPQPNRTKSMKTNLSFSPTFKVGVERDCIPAPNHFNGLQMNLPAHVFAGAI